jgi:hypothetical protein
MSKGKKFCGKLREFLETIGTLERDYNLKLYL